MIQMTTHHNKKRNVGVIHEQLVRYIGGAIIAGDKQLADKTLDILTRRFRKGTELYKEFRLFNALVNEPMGNTELARLVVNEARSASSSHDKQKLSQEKSLLIKEINHVLGENRFYDIRVPNYRLYATVQSLLDNWRGSKLLDIGAVAKYEHGLTEWLSREKLNESAEPTASSDPLVQKIMMQSFKTKYSEKLLPSQKSIVEAVMLRDSATLRKELEKARLTVLRSLKEYQQNCESGALLEKVEKAVQAIENFEPQNENTDVGRTMQLLELVAEIKGENDE